MRNDYKWWYVKRDDSGFITEVAMRFYEGDYEVQVIDETPTVVYVRSSKLGAESLTHLDSGTPSTDSADSYVHIYTNSDFGSIKTDDELRAFCNVELAKDESRTPITEQEVK